MRKLKTRDVPAFCRCLKQMGLQEELKAIAVKASSGADEEAVGLDLVQALFEYATEINAEACLYEFLAPIFEATPEELADMDLSEFIAGLKQIGAENNLAVFFNSAAAMTK